MININRILKDNRLMRATTGLSLVGFENLCVEFAKSRLDIKEKQYQKLILASFFEQRNKLYFRMNEGSVYFPF